VFREWCEAVELVPLPATSHTVALFVAAEAKLGQAPSTLSRRLSAIRLMIAIPRIEGSSYCPVRAVTDWIVVAGITQGPVFRPLHRGDNVGRSRLSAPSVALVVKELAGKAGLDAGRYAGHSLRSGFLTSAARNRASIFKMADQSRHKSLDVLRALRPGCGAN